MFRVVFAGLMTIVPYPPAPDVPTSACVVVADARTEQTDSLESPEKIEKHVPHLRFPEALLSPDSPLKPTRQRIREDGTKELVVELDGDDLAFVRAGATTAEPFEITSGTRETNSLPCCQGPPPDCPADAKCSGTPAHPYLKQKEDIWWVLRPEEGIPTANKTLDDCFESPLPTSASVSRVLLSEGRLFTYRLEGQDSSDDPIAAKVKRVMFEGGDPMDYRAVAREVALEVAVPGSQKTVHVVLEPKDPAKPPRILTLTWLSGSDATITVDNMPEHRFLDAKATHPQAFSKRHFEHLYRLVETGVPPADDPGVEWPVPTRIDATTDLLCPLDLGKP